MINGIFIIDDVLSKQECDDLIYFYNNVGPTHQWGTTFPMSIDKKNVLLFEKPQKICNKINEYINPKIEIDWCEIVKWPENSNQNFHFDEANKDTIFTSITYLNSDYDGGNTMILNDIKLIPKIGRTVYFDGNHYMHGVSNIEKNIRYTLPIWYKGKINAM